MQIKLTYARAEGMPSADLQVTADATVTVGDLADHLALADPDHRVQGSGFTLRVGGPAGFLLAPSQTLSDAGIGSGAVVALAARGRQPEISPTDAAATIVVRSGPDKGREFPIRAGTSYIGRGRDCEVQLKDPMMSRRHAKVHVADTVELSDLGSVNGILVGDDPVDRVVLRSGDAVCLGETVISVRSRPVAIDGSAGPPLIRFNRAPRIAPRFDGKSFALPEPPSTQRGQRFPILPLFAPLLMGAALYLTTKSMTSLIFMAMSPLMMVGNVVEGQLAGKRTYRRDMDAFEERKETMRSELAACLEDEVRTRRSENPSLPEIAEAIEEQSALLWARRPDLAGFGELRLGLGQQPTRSKIEFPLGRRIEGPILRELHDAFDPLQVVEEVPVVVPLDQQGALGIAGALSLSRDAARGYVLQLAGLHSPAEVIVCAICGPAAAGEWEWLKWLPHCGSSQSPLGSDPLASGRTSYVALLGEIESLIRSRQEHHDSADAALPRVVVVLDEPPESERSRLVDIAEHGSTNGVWVVWVARDLGILPAACKTVVEIDEPGRGTALLVGTSKSVVLDSVDGLSLSMAEDLGRKLSPVVDAATREFAESDIPRTVSMLTLVGNDLATQPESVLERWVENRSVLSGPWADQTTIRGRAANLRAVLGESAFGPHVLDLKVHGPHALVGGTTGAGKSEMLQSWIIGMALSNSPQRLTFLLVDYKGGSAFSDCVHLPHTVGLVTDLSPHLVRRALTSLSAELRYRERILHRKKAKDLAALEVEGDPDAPPSLVIVVDEFAALVKEVPEFVDGVVNVAQRGRSLGLHLVLATQRPSGVIRDNLRANTNLRIALRMADVADSTDVIGSKLAAGFDPGIPGRAASRTGPTALTPFQTGYVGGWTSSSPDRPSLDVTTFGFGSRFTWEMPLDQPIMPAADGPTDIQRLVGSISHASDLAELAAPRKPWVPELAPVYDLAKLPTQRRDDDLVFAVADDPGNQAQISASFRPDDDGNMAIFGTGNSGKSTLLRTLAVAAGFTVRGGPCHVYGLDFAARGLQMIEQLPHVGGVISGSDTERVGRLFRMIRDTIDQRASAYAEVGAGSVTQYRRIAERPEEPRILLLVDGMGALRSAYEGTEHHRLFESFLSIAADGRQVGVHVIVTADRAGAIPTALGSLIQRRVVLRLAGENDYAMLSQPSDVIEPKSPPGRGLFDGLEIQVAVLGGSADVLDQDVAMRRFGSAMVDAGAKAAPSVRKLEEEVWLEALDVHVDDKPVFALAAETLSEIAFDVSGTFSVAGPPGSGRTSTLATIAAAVRRWRPESKLVYFGSRRSVLATQDGWDRVALNVSEATELANEVPTLLGELGDGEPPAVVLIENLTGFVQSPADGPLQTMIKWVADAGHLVVSEGEPMPLSGLQPLLQVARSSRVGLVLQPEQTDGTLFRAQFPRVRKPDFPPGRGLYVARGGQPSVVQVALAGSPPR